MKYLDVKWIYFSRAGAIHFHHIDSTVGATFFKLNRYRVRGRSDITITAGLIQMVGCSTVSNAPIGVCHLQNMKISVGQNDLSVKSILLAAFFKVSYILMGFCKLKQDCSLNLLLFNQNGGILGAFGWIPGEDDGVIMWDLVNCTAGEFRDVLILNDELDGLAENYPEQFKVYYAPNQGGCYILSEVQIADCKHFHKKMEVNRPHEA